MRRPYPTGGASSGRSFWLGYKLHVTETCDDAPPCTCCPARRRRRTGGGRDHDKDCADPAFPNLITHVATTERHGDRQPDDQRHP